MWLLPIWPGACIGNKIGISLMLVPSMFIIIRLEPEYLSSLQPKQKPLFLLSG